MPTDAQTRCPRNSSIEVLPNRRPELKFIQPKGDQRVSALQEVSRSAAEAWDDFGMPQFGMSYTVAGGEHERSDFRRKAPNRMSV